MYKHPNYVYGDNDRFIFASLHFGEYILKKLWERKNDTALIDGLTNEAFTYGDIAQEAMNLAVSLTRMGVRKGDVVAISSENRREFWGTVIGIICAGGVATTHFSYLSCAKDELAHVMNIAKPIYISTPPGNKPVYSSGASIFCSPFAYKQHSKSYKSMKFLKKIILFGEERKPNTTLYNDIAVASHVIPNNVGNTDITKNTVITKNVKYEDFVCVEVTGQIDTAFILYSSGTTGLPKGVMLTHLNITMALSPVIEMPPGRSLSIRPWYHTMGLVTTLLAFVRGNTVVYLPKFDVDMYLKTIKKYKISYLAVVPTMLVALCKSKLQYDTSSVIVMHSGTAPLYEETAKVVQERFPSVLAILQGYGLTESTLTLTMNDNPEKMGSVGTPLHNIVLKVIHPETKEVLGPNKEGEICAKGLGIMKGYIGKDRREDFDEEGFFRTGDLGYYDDEGYFYIVERLKELIKYMGCQVPPAEIEAMLLKHNGIRDAAVVGLPDLSAGELPLAFVVLQPGVELTEREIQEYVAERLSNPKQLRGGVRFINEIPKNHTSKILRKELRKMIGNKKSKP